MRDTPLHDARVHPLAALAIRLHASGVAGYEGEVDLTDGEATFGRLRIKGPEIDMEVQGHELTIPAAIPEMLVPAIAGRRLGDVAELPSSGDPALDAAVAAIPVETAEAGTVAGRSVLTLGIGPVEGVRAMPHAP